MDLVVKNSKSLTRNMHYFHSLCERALEKFWTVKFSDTLLSELFLRPNFFVINVVMFYPYIVMLHPYIVMFYPIYIFFWRYHFINSTSRSMI